MIQSFKFAISGLIYFFKEERNAKIHLFLFLLAVILGAVLHISSYEWLAIFMCSGAVFASEAMNTAIENLCDFVCENQNYKIKKIKDISAAAVLLSSLFALIVGVSIFLPKFLLIFQ